MPERLGTADLTDPVIFKKKTVTSYNSVYNLLQATTGESKRWFLEFGGKTMSSSAFTIVLPLKDSSWTMVITVYLTKINKARQVK